MDKRQITKMVFSLILPPVMVILLFAVAIGAIIIPATEDALMQRKKDIIQAIVTSATSIMEKHAQMDEEDLESKEEAQLAAISEMRSLRYGDDNKDYLWITDLKPEMVMHPYFPELEGTLLDDYKDPNGRLFFVEAVDLAQKDGDGYINYMWPRERNIEESIPKISYIKLFEPWGWVVGSGIYLDDVYAEIRAVTFRLFLISGLIGFIVILLLLFVIKRGWESEKGRYLAEKELISSHARYQALAHASGEILILTMNGVITGANKKACELLEMNEQEILSHRFDEFISDNTGLEMLARAESTESVAAVETVLKGRGEAMRIILSAEKAIVHESPAIMYVGYSLQLKDDPDIGLIMQESLGKNGFGLLTLDNSIGTKVLSADRIAVGLLAESNNASITGKSLKSFVQEEDASRLFIELQTEKKVSGLLVRCSSGLGKTRHLKVWASVIEDIRDEKGHIIVFLLDVSKSVTENLVKDELLSDFLSPVTKAGPLDYSIMQSTTEINPYKEFIQTKILLSHSVKMGLLADKVTTAATRSINGIFDAAVLKAITLLGVPPCRYALLAFGSIGRSEPTFNADQDTAIIYDPGENTAFNNDIAEYFHQFGEIVTSFGAEAGLPPCNAENTAANPKWCMSLKEWKKQFYSWIRMSEPQNLILVNIFFDFRTIAGDNELALNLRQYIFNEAEKWPIFFYNLAQDTLAFRSPSDIFGRIRPDSRKENYINIKGTMLHFVNFARIYSLRYCINEINTIKRIYALAEAEHISHETAEDTVDAWMFLMSLRLRNQVSAIEKNFPQENVLILDELSSIERSVLKKAIGHINNLQYRITTDFKITG